MNNRDEYLYLLLRIMLKCSFSCIVDLCKDWQILTA